MEVDEPPDAVLSGLVASCWERYVCPHGADLGTPTVGLYVDIDIVCDERKDEISRRWCGGAVMVKNVHLTICEGCRRR